MSKTIIAIDFGTCNSYVSYVEDNDNHNAIVKPLELPGLQGTFKGIQSVVLYHDKGRRKGKMKYGESALKEYLPETDQRREEEGMRLAMNFKPDICLREEAKEDAINFLKFLKNETDPFIRDFDQAQVIIGVPSEASRMHDDDKKNDFCKTLKEIAREAGWGDVRLLDEPFGPLFTWHDSKSVREIRDELLNKNYLVVDFGGGTCDFAVLKDGKLVIPSWGDMCLGGRLFDDLFYQWTLDLSDIPEYNEERHIIIGKDGHFRDFICREIKEKFSSYMLSYYFQHHNMDCEYIVDNPRIRRNGMLTFTWDEFEQRAMKYKPSKSFCKTYTKLLHTDISTTQFKIDQEVNLFDWFKRVMLEGFRKNNIGIETIDYVLLSGGSSFWPFVRKMCVEIFSEPKVKNIHNFHEAIANGLAKYTLVKEQTKETMSALNKTKVDKIEEISRFVSDKLKKDAREFSDNIASGIFDKVVLKSLDTFKDTGGTIVSLRKKLDNSVKVNRTEVKEYIKTNIQDEIRKINNHIIELLNDWFRKIGVSKDEFTCHNAELSLFNYEQTDEQLYSLGVHSFNNSINFFLKPLIGFIDLLRIPMIKRITSWLVDKEKIRKEFCKEFSKEFSEKYNHFLDSRENDVKEAIEKMVNNQLDQYNRILEMEN